MNIVDEKNNDDGTVDLTVDLTEEDEKILDELAESLQMSREDAFVHALEKYVESEKHKELTQDLAEE